MNDDMRRNQRGMDADKIIRFRDMAVMELKRAERYRNFLALLVLNLSEFLDTAGRRKIETDSEANAFIEQATRRVKASMRETDMISRLDDSRLVMLLPETDDSGAKITANRIGGLISDFMSEFLESDYNFDVPVEISSFPEAAGRKSFQSRINSLFGSPDQPR